MNSVVNKMYLRQYPRQPSTSCRQQSRIRVHKNEYNLSLRLQYAVVVAIWSRKKSEYS